MVHSRSTDIRHHACPANLNSRCTVLERSSDDSLANIDSTVSSGTLCFPASARGLINFSVKSTWLKKYASDFYIPTDLFPLVSSSPMASEVLNFYSKSLYLPVSTCRPLFCSPVHHYLRLRKSILYKPHSHFRFLKRFDLRLVDWF